MINHNRFEMIEGAAFEDHFFFFNFLLNIKIKGLFQLVQCVFL